MKKKKLLFILHSSALTGGAEDDIENLLERLRKKNNYEIHGLFPAGPRKKKYMEYFDKWGILRWGIFPVIYEGIFKYIKYFIKSFIQFYQIWKFIRSEKYDLCLISVAVLLWPVIFLKLLNQKLIVFIKETIEPKLFRKIIYKTISFCAIFIIPNSNIIENEFFQFTGNKNVQTVYSSIEERKAVTMDDREYETILGEKAFLSLNNKNSLKLLIIGNFTKVKNPIIAAQAIKIIKSELAINPVLFIVGSTNTDKSYFKYFNNYVIGNGISDNIFLLGTQEKRVFNYLYNKADIFIIPSISEGIPLVLVYALKFGTPVIAANVGGIPDIIENNSNGILIEPDKQSLYKAVTLLYNNTELKKKIAANGYNTYLEKFNFEKNMDNIEDIIINNL